MILHDSLKKAGKTSDDIKEIKIRTQKACIEIIDKKGPLNNPADRDHCVQYMVRHLSGLSNDRSQFHLSTDD
jgi:2-methylcitrate dehydratase